jgi:hypothetical protein
LIIYSIYSYDTIFQKEEEKRQYFTMEVEGKTLVMELKDGKAQVVRLLSPDPLDYLDPRFQPGKSVIFSLPN